MDNTDRKFLKIYMSAIFAISAFYQVCLSPVDWGRLIFCSVMMVVAFCAIDR